MRTRKRQKLEKNATLNQLALQPIQPLLHSFFTLDSSFHFAGSNTLFKRYLDEGMAWKKLYEQQYGSLHHKGDYKAQFIAEFLLSDLIKREQTQIEIPDTSLLHNHLIQHVDKPWTYYYLTKIFLICDKTKVLATAFNALRANDTRVIEHLIRYFQTEISNEMVSQDEINTFITLLQAQADSQLFTLTLSLAYSFLVKNSAHNELQVRQQCHSQALKLFFESLNHTAVDNRLFLSYFTKIFYNLSILNKLQAYNIFLYRPLEKLQNVFEILVDLILSRHSYPFRKIILPFMKTKADNGDGLVAFYYANYLRRFLLKTYLLNPTLSDDVIQKEKNTIQYYFLKAFQQKHFESLCGLLSIMSFKPELAILSEQDLYHLVLTNTVSQDKSVYATLANLIPKMPGWFLNKEQVWLFMQAIQLHDYPKQWLNTLYKQTLIPEKSRYTQCALTFIYAAQEKWLAAHDLYSQAILTDTHIYYDFLATGQKHEPYFSKYNDFVSILSEHYQKNAIHKRSIIRFKH